MITGWYVVYILMVFLNCTLWYLHGYNMATWEYWVSGAMLILAFISGSRYKKDND